MQLEQLGGKDPGQTLRRADSGSTHVLDEALPLSGPPFPQMEDMKAN